MKSPVETKLLEAIADVRRAVAAVEKVTEMSKTSLGNLMGVHPRLRACADDMAAAIDENREYEKDEA